MLNLLRLLVVKSQRSGVSDIGMGCSYTYDDFKQTFVYVRRHKNDQSLGNFFHGEE